VILRRRGMGNIPELRKQNSAWGSQEWPGVMRCERERGKRGKENEHLTNPKQSTIFGLPTEFCKQRITVKLNVS